MKYLHVTPVIGLPQVTGWSQVAENSHTAPNRLICAFALHGEQAGNVGRDISEDISQFEPQTLEEAFAFLENLETRYQDDDVSIYFAAGIFMRGECAYAVKGGSVLLKRDKKAGPIVYSSGNLKVVAGKYTNDDVIVMATHQATHFFNEIEQKFETGFDTDTIITSIIPGLHAMYDSSLSALAFIVPTLGDAEPEDEAYFEASFEASDDVTEVVVDDSDDDLDDADAEDETESAEVSAVDEPTISPDDVEAPSESALADLGIGDAPPVDAEPNPALVKLWQILKRLAKLAFAGLGFVWTLLKRLAVKFWQLVRQVRPADLQPRNMAQQIRSKMDDRGAYLRQRKSSKKLKMAAIGALFLAVILIGFYVYFARMQDARLQARENLSAFSQSLEQAQASVAENPVAARESVGRVIQQLKVLRAEQMELGNKVFVEEIDAKLAEAEALYEAISGQEEFSELQIFYDLRLVESDFVATEADAFGNIAAMIDKEKKRLVILNLESKQPTVVDLSSLGEIRDVRAQSDRVVILADGVYEVALGADASPEKIIEEGDSNRRGVLLGVYDRYVYVLNTEKRNVYRYARQDNGEYSDPVGWMQAARGLRYETVSSWTIDGEIWMVTEEGEVNRFASGQSVNFNINGLSEPLNSSLRISTFIEGDSLYILEPGNRRLVVLNKNGDFLREVKSASLASANSLIVSETLNKAFAVSGSILFEIPL